MVTISPPLLTNVQEFGDYALEGGADVPLARPFYFALVDATETTFGSQHHRMDAYVFSAQRVLSEGEKPKLILEIENPHVGLLSPTRKQWCWFAWDNGSTIVPLFFGRIVGTPNDLQDGTIQVTFISWPSDYVRQLQALAETLKVAPYYDAVLIDIAHRDDPMTIFETYSRMVVVDPVTLVVSASDIIEGEDGTVDFTEDDHFYDSVHTSLGAVPKNVVYVDATFSWTQMARGYLNMGSAHLTGPGGDGMLSDWPKPLSNLAPGLTVVASTVADKNDVEHITMATFSWNYTNTERTHQDGDTLSASWSTTIPISMRGAVSLTPYIISYSSQSGVLDPFAQDSDGDPAPLNIPASLQATTAYVANYDVTGTMIVEYNAARPHTERVIFRLYADVQPTVLDPTVSEDSDTIVISSSDVGVPLLNLLNWSTVAGTHVEVGTVIFPDDPQLPGGRTAQRATVAGTAGLVPPDFSDVPGETTVDGGVTWASLGVAQPTEAAPDWTGVSNVPEGTVILPHRPIFIEYTDYIYAGTQQFPPVSTPISEGVILRKDGVFQVCTLSGIVGPQGTTATFVSLGTALPTGTTYFIAIQGGTTGAQYVIPQFNNTLNAQTVDGSVIWVSIGTGEIPAGGVPGNVTASTYVCQDRGRNVSIPNLILRARARLRYSSRCVTTSFQCSYLRGTELTLRKNVTLHDPRLPGGLVAGKITGTALVATNGEFTTNVTIMSAVGKAQVIEEVNDGPTYVVDGYVADGYAHRDNRVVLVPTVSDVAYTPLTPIPDEDGIVFPLTKSALVVSEGIVSVGNQAQAVEQAMTSLKKIAELSVSAGDVTAEAMRQRQIAMESANSLSALLAKNPKYYEYVLKPLNGNGAFNRVYHLKCTELSIEKMIDLEAESTT